MSGVMGERKKGGEGKRERSEIGETEIMKWRRRESERGRVNRKRWRK